MNVETRPLEDGSDVSKQRCDPDEIALKSFFMGPQSENATWFQEVIQHVVETYLCWRKSVYPDDGRAISDADLETPEFQRNRGIFLGELDELLERFEAEVPKFSPRYIGHMFSETSMPAMVGHLVTLLHNPNNISGESSRVGVQIEDEAVRELAKMLDFESDRVRGHFTSGGTVANFEAMVRARHRFQRFLATGARAREMGLTEMSLFEAAQMGWDTYDDLCGQLGPEAEQPVSDNPFAVADRLSTVFAESYRGPVILVPDHKHYSWVKGVELMGLGREAFWSVRLDKNGVMDVDRLADQIDEARRQSRPIMMVVSVAGTTELGAFDPVHRIQDLLEEYAADGVHIYHHVDAAYGGFFAANICGGSTDCVMASGVCEALASMNRVNSVTLDPHKLGYVPYSSGAFVAREPREYFSSTIDAPYLAFKEGLDRGPQTIEGSRSAAGAVATWLTARTIGLHAGGYGRILRRTIRGRRTVEAALKELDLPVRVIPAATNIIGFCVAPEGESLSQTNARTSRIYEAFSPDSDGEFFVSRTTLRFSEYGAMLRPFVDGWQGDCDEEDLLLIRLCIMNPFIGSRETDVDFASQFARAVAEVCEE